MWTRHAVHCWKTKDALISDFLLWTSIHWRARVGLANQQERIYISSERTEDVVWKTCREQVMIGSDITSKRVSEREREREERERERERKSGKSILSAWLDDIFIYIYIYIYIYYSLKVFFTPALADGLSLTLCDTKFLHVSRTLLSILAYLNHAVVWFVSVRTPISKSLLFTYYLLIIAEVPVV